jgi:hypothetical protein
MAKPPLFSHMIHRMEGANPRLLICVVLPKRRRYVRNVPVRRRIQKVWFLPRMTVKRSTDNTLIGYAHFLYEICNEVVLVFFHSLILA